MAAHSPFSSSEFTADDLEAAEALLLQKTTDPESNDPDFFPRWLETKKRLLPYDERRGEGGQRPRPDAPPPPASIGGDENPMPPPLPPPPLPRSSKTEESLKTATGKGNKILSLKRIVVEAESQYQNVEEDNSPLRQIQYDQTLVQQQQQWLELYPPSLANLVGPNRRMAEEEFVAAAAEAESLRRWQRAANCAQARKRRLEKQQSKSCYLDRKMQRRR